MNQWIVKLIAASLILTVCSCILPAGNLKKTAVLLFGFIFTSVLIAPVSLISDKDLLSEARMLFTSEYSKNQNIEGQAGGMIIENYTATVSDIIKEYINDNSKYYCDRCTVYVNDNIDSPDFGKITTVYCYVSPVKDDNSIIQGDKNQIQQIIIDINGIHTETNKNPEDTSYKEEIRAIVSGYLKIELNKIHILDIKEQ